MMKPLLRPVQVLCMLVLLVQISVGQNQTQCTNRRGNIWMFGDHAGLDFNSGSPQAITNGSMFSNEGCSSIADENGNLLFYSNGITIWDRSHGVMQNGNGLQGNLSTTQSGLIIPVPGNANQYYVFSLAQLGEPAGLRYSVVDMTLNGGFGAVTAVKNVFITNNLTERVTAVRHANNTDFWLIVHRYNNADFLAYPITAAGIGAVITSTVGLVHSGGSQPNYNGVGYMKASPDGSRLAVALRDNAYQLFNFSNATGVVSNPITLNRITMCYGLEFSPSSNYLYIADYIQRTVHQYSITLASQAAIEASRIQIGTSTRSLGALQLGPDGRIYVAKSISYAVGVNTLGVINNPDLATASYVDNGVNLGNATNLSLAGLPNFITSLFELNFTLSGIQTLCAGSQNITYTASDSTFDYTWTVVSGDANIVGSDTGTSVQLSVGAAGTVVLSTTATACGRTQTKTYTITVVPVPVANAGLQEQYCVGYYDIPLTSTVRGGVYTVNGIVSTVFHPYTLGTSTIVYTLTTAAGCTDSDTIEVEVIDCCKYKIGDVTAVCGNSNTPFCVPLTAVVPVDSGIIGMDYCLQYDPLVMVPTGNYTLGNLVTHGNVNWATAFLNTTVAGQVRASIHYTSAAPAGLLFQGSGNVICIEFTLLNAASVSTNILSSCELEEAYLLTEKTACWTPGSLIVIYDSQLRGKLIYQGNLAKPLGMTYAVTNPNMAVTNITQADSNCTVIGTAVNPNQIGNFNLNVGTADQFKIVRDIIALPNTPQYTTMRYINGYDTYLMQNITTKKTIGVNLVLPNAYMMIAADVNMNNRVRANDITLVQERIVKKIIEYPQVWNSAPNTYEHSLDWRFIDKNTVDTNPSFVRSNVYPEDDNAGFYRDNVPNVPFCLPVVPQCLDDERVLYSGILLGDLFDGGPLSYGFPQPYPTGGDPYIRTGETTENAVVQFEVDDITPLGDNTYRVYVKHSLRAPDTLVSFDFVIDYNESVLSILDVQESAESIAAGANIMWNDANQEELILTSYSTGMYPISGNLFYIDVYKATGIPTVEDFGTTHAFLNGVEVSATASLKSAPIDETNNSSASVSLVPNPSSDIVHIAYAFGSVDSGSEIEVVDMLGKTVASFKGLSNVGVAKLDVASLQQGVYHCVVVNGSTRIVKKMVVGK